MIGNAEVYQLYVEKRIMALSFVYKTYYSQQENSRKT